MKKVEYKDFKSLNPLSSFVKDKIKNSDLLFSIPSQEKRDDIILKICKYLLADEVVVAGSHRKNDWENGWDENLQKYKKTRDIKSIVPRYFGKYDVQRLNGEFIVQETDGFESKLVSLLQYAIFNKYFKDSTSIYEFGAGTGHNLLRVREINPTAKLYSMEWTASGVELINCVAKNINDQNLSGIVFDNFNPNYNVRLDSNASIYTFASLEQMGDKTDDLIKYWTDNKAAVIVNIEPMAEPLDDNELLQYLSSQYFKKRGYLNNYINKLKTLEEEGEIIIHDIIRTGVGSLFIEGYSIIAWSPIQLVK